MYKSHILEGTVLIKTKGLVSELNKSIYNKKK